MGRFFYFCIMLDKKELTIIGTMGKPHGVAGESSVRLLPGLESAELTPSFIFIEIDGGPVPFRVENYRYKNDDILLVKLPLLNHEDKIRQLINCNVFISPAEISTPSADFNSPETFSGYKVVDQTAGLLGKISHIQDISGNPLFIIETSKGEEIMIPATEDFIVNIDDSKKMIEMDIPEGLVNVNE